VHESRCLGGRRAGEFRLDLTGVMSGARPRAAIIHDGKSLQINQMTHKASGTGPVSYDHKAVETFPWPVVAGYHDVHRWMVYGDPEGWWPLYTQDGPVNLPPEPKASVGISLRANPRPHR